MRREAAKCLPKLVNPAPKMAVILAEKVLYDTDAAVRNRALKVLERVDLGGSRARSIVLAGTRHDVVDIRRACVEMLHRFMGEDEQRSFAQERLQVEQDPGIRNLLMEMIFDPEIDGSEEQKNRFLSPAEPVPLLDREVAQAMDNPSACWSRAGGAPRQEPPEGAAFGQRQRPTALREARRSPRRSGVVMEDVTYDDKAEQFERLWDGMTPKGINRNKALKFRQYILEHVRQTKRPLTRENARKYWMGQLQQEIKDAESFETREVATVPAAAEPRTEANRMFTRPNLARGTSPPTFNPPSTAWLGNATEVQRDTVPLPVVAVTSSVRRVPDRKDCRFCLP